MKTVVKFKQSELLVRRTLMLCYPNYQTNHVMPSYLFFFLLFPCLEIKTLTSLLTELLSLALLKCFVRMYVSILFKVVRRFNATRVRKYFRVTT